MNRISLATIFLSLPLAAVLLAPAQAQEEVRIYNWSDYIDESLLEKFEEETGIAVIYDVFDSNEILETKLLAGQSGYDVVVPSASFLQRQIQAGVFRPLDKSKLPNRRHLWDLIAERVAAYDPGNRHSINYMWGTTGIGADAAKVREILGEDAPLDSLDLIFNPEHMEKLSGCGVYFLDAPADVIPAALIYLGEDPDSQDVEVIAEAEAVLRAVRPYVAKFHSSEYINALANGEICVAFGWSGDILQARDRADEAENGVEIVFHPPSEGALMWFDQMAIPADAPNPDAAHRFLDFIMEPENMAAASNHVYFANGNLGSQEYLDAEVLEDAAIYPDAAVLDSLYTTRPWGREAQRFVTRLWNRVKSGT